MADIKHILFIDAPRRKVFEAISTPEGFAGWWTTGTSGETNISGLITFRFGKDVANFKVIRKQIHQFIELAYHGKKHDEWFNTKILIRLSADGPRTQVELMHTNYAYDNAFYAQCNYRWGQYLRSLKDYCEKGSGSPFVHK